MNKWQEQLTPEEVSLVEWIDGSDMELYGYHRNAGSITTATITRGMAVAAFDSVRRQVAGLPYLWCSLTQPTRLALQEYRKYRDSWEVVFPGLLPSISKD